MWEWWYETNCANEVIKRWEAFLDSNNYAYFTSNNELKSWTEYA